MFDSGDKNGSHTRMIVTLASLRRQTHTRETIIFIALVLKNT